MSRNTLYDRCNKFYLSVNDFTEYDVGVVIDTIGMVEVDEPIGWDNVRATLSRDLRTHGVVFSFTDGEQELNFNCENGRSVLRTSYLTYGTDAQVKFLFGEYDEDSNEFISRFVGDVNFNIYKFDEDYSIANVEARDFGRLVNSRIQNKVVLDIDVPEAVTIGLGSKLLPQLLRLKHTGLGIYDRVPSNTNLKKAFFMPQYADGATTRYGELTIPNYSGTFVGEEPTTLKRYLFQVERSGLFTIDVDTCIEIPIQLITGNNRVRLKSALWREVSEAFISSEIKTETSYEIVYSDGTVLTYANRNAAVGFPNIGIVAERYYFSGFNQTDLNIPTTLLEGDEVYLYFEIERISALDMPIGSVVRVASSLNKAEPYNYKIVSNASFPASQIEALRVKDCLNQVIAKLVEDIPEYSGAAIESAFLDACGTDLVLTNGLTLRDAFGTQGLDQSVSVSIEDILEMLRAIYNTGFSFEFDGTDKVLRIEPSSYFYRDVEILELDEPYDYIEEAYPETTYNEVEAGFTTFSKQRDDSSDFKDSSLQDINARTRFGLPIRTQKNKYDIVSPIIFSSFEIESQRRIQYNEEELDKNKSYKNDDEVFGIAINTQDTSKILFAAKEGTGQITLLGAIRPFIAVGDSIRLVTPDFVNVGSAVTVTSIDYRGYTTKIEYSGTELDIPLISSTGITVFMVVRVVNQTGGRIVNESVEPYFFIDNIGGSTISKADYLETEYNLRFTPKRMMLAHANIINNCLLEKDDTDVIRYIDGEGNTALTTILNSFEPCPNGDFNYVSLTEDSDLLLSNFNNKESLYRNRLIKFKHLINWDDFNDLQKSMKNSDGTKDYGFISFTDLDGVVRTGFLLNCNFNVFNNEADFELLEVSTPSVAPTPVFKLNVSPMKSSDTLACQEPAPTQTFFTTDNPPVVNSVLSTSSTLVGIVPSGFYKWFLSDTESVVIEVSFSEIVSINSCPDVYPVGIGETNFVSESLACTSTDNTVVRYSSDSVLDVGSSVFFNVGLTNFIPAGFYKLPDGRVAQVAGTGDIVAITNCDTVYDFVASSGFSDGASACQSVSGVSTIFSLDGVIIVGSVLFINSSLSQTLPEGFYKIIDTDETVEVDSNGEVLSIVTCDDFGEKSYYYGGLVTATPSSGDIETLTEVVTVAPIDEGFILAQYVINDVGRYYYFAFPNVWFDLVDITDGFNDTISWFVNWEEISGVTIDGTNYRVFRTIEQMDTINYVFRFLFRDI